MTAIREASVGSTRAQQIGQALEGGLGLGDHVALPSRPAEGPSVLVDEPPD